MDESDYCIEHEDILYEAKGDITKLYSRLKNGAPVLQNSIGFKESRSEKLTRLAKNLNLDMPGGDVNLDTTTKNMSNLKMGSRKATGNEVRRTDKSDRATSDQVLDPRTRIILLKMLNQNVISEIHGCISTGKEANVYHGITEDGLHRAIKIYKTSILIFKDRDRYVTGEYRFRSGYCKHNSRKMVKVWAEKELRNMKRLFTSGVPSPEPYLLKSNVLVMELIGDQMKGIAAPRLKDAEITNPKKTYKEVLKIMRQIYKKCRLVHSDFSEYNLLYHEERVFVIDVGQAVEHDHPNALEFLRKDCLNVRDFFKRKGIEVMSIVDMFEYITGDHGKLDEDEAEADLWIEEHVKLEHLTTEDDFFMKAFIPRSLNEVINVDKDVQLVIEEGSDNLIYKTIAGVSHGVVSDSSSESSEEDSGYQDSNEEGTDEETNSQEEDIEYVPKPVVDKAALKAQRKENKKQVKEEKKTRRIFRKIESKPNTKKIPKTKTFSENVFRKISE